MALQTGLTILGDFIHTGAQAAGTVWRPTAVSAYAELDSHEVAEIQYVEIVPPVAAGPTIENLTSVYLILDETATLELINLDGTQSTNMAPAQTLMRNWKNDDYERAAGSWVATLGVPLLYAVKPAFAGKSLLTTATCPKYTRKVRVETVAGTGGISANYRIRLWGIKYDAKDLHRLIGPIGGTETITDTIRGKTLIVSKPQIPVTEETWAQLPGGVNQSLPKINTFIRWSTNVNATTPATPYQFRYDNGMVSNREHDLYFPYDQEKKALLLTHLGVREATNLQNVYVEIGGTKYPKGLNSNRPGWEIGTGSLNQMHYGEAVTLTGETGSPFIYPIPRLERPFLIHEEKGFIAALDNGTAVAAGGIKIAIKGVLIEMQ